MTRDVPGTVYLLHFDEPCQHARHYTGWASDLDARLEQHRAGRGARLMEVIREAGITWSLARTWPGTRNRERQLKEQGGASRHCPACKGQPIPQRQPVTIEASYRVAVPAPRKPAPELPPLWESVVSHLEPAEASALMDELDAAERLAWDAATPDAGPEYEARFDVACDLSRLRGEEASAVVRLAEARAIAAAEGWRELAAAERDREMEAG